MENRCFCFTFSILDDPAQYGIRYLSAAVDTACRPVLHNADICLLPVGALWNLIPVVRANAAAAVVLLGCMFLFSGLLPLCWKLLRIGAAWLKNQTGIWLAAIRHLFVKAVN